MTSTLTSQLSEETLSAALDSFRSALGPDAVIDGEDELRDFRDPFAFDTWDDYTASAVLMPETVEEIQAIVRIANELEVPLWTHGTGMNNGYGGPAPRLKGSVIVSLRRMNRVLEINEDSAYAVVEPGVRWFDLYDAIRAGGHRLMVSDPRPRLGQRRRQRPRERRHVPPARLRHGGRVRDGGGAAERGAAQDRHGGDARQQGVARVQAQPRPLPRHAVHAVELRDRDEDGRLADAHAGVLHAALAPGLERRRSSRAGRDASRAHARAHDRERPADLEHDRLRLGAVLPIRLVRGGGADPRRGGRHDRARARGRPLDDALRPLRRRGGRRPPLPEGEGGVRADPRRRGVGREARPGRVWGAREPARARPGRRPQPRHQPDDRLVRRRGGRAHRLLAGRAGSQARTPSRCET